MTLAHGEAPCSLRPETLLLSSPGESLTPSQWGLVGGTGAEVGIGTEQSQHRRSGEVAAASPSHTAWGSPPLGA